MTASERAILWELDKVLRRESVQSQLPAIIDRVQKDLAARKEAVMAWEPIPLPLYGDKLPNAIRSSWIFILRAGADTGAERHPNSHQRMMSFSGRGDMQIGSESVKKLEGDSVETNQPPELEIQWESNPMISDPAAPLEQRWISIPPNVWHRPVIAKAANWTVVSFHTVPAEELIEERPGTDPTETRQMRYMAKPSSGQRQVETKTKHSN